MIISHSRRFIFVKSEKTGGTSVERAIQPFLENIDIFDEGSHFLPTQIVESHGKNTFDEYFKFSIIRNPFDKMVSHYYWHGHIEPGRYESFDIFVEEFYKYKIISNWKYFSIDNSIVLDRILRYENLQDDLNSIYINTGICIDVSGIHEKSNIRPTDATYQSYYSDATRNMVEIACSQEIAMFGYIY